MRAIKNLSCALPMALCLSAQSNLPHVSHLRRIDDHIYSGHQPNREGFVELRRMGIKTVFDLRGGAIHRPRERRDVEDAGMQYVTIRLSGIWAPKPPQVQEVLAVMEKKDNWPIFIHCRRGDDRVGLAIACYRMDYYHWTNQEAYGEASHNGMSHFEILMRRFIRNYDPASSKSSALHTPGTIGFTPWTSSSSISMAPSLIPAWTWLTP